MWPQDIFVDRNLTDNEIVTAFANILAVAPTKIYITENIADDALHGRISDEKAVLCERMQVQGDFVLRLSIYLRTPALEQLDSMSIIMRFSELLHCACLVSDDSDNPYTWLLVQGLDKIQPVSLDMERLDKEEFVVHEASVAQAR